MFAKITTWIAVTCMVLAISALDSDSWIPLVTVFVCAGWLFLELVANWDWLIRHDEVEQLLRKKR